jgi:hypothetical protein
MSRCQRSTVSGVTIIADPARRDRGIYPSNAASSSPSAQVILGRPGASAHSQIDGSATIPGNSLLRHARSPTPPVRVDRIGFSLAEQIAARWTKRRMVTQQIDEIVGIVCTHACD